MIEWESPDRFIGTTAALISLAAAAATSGAAVYSANKQAGAAHEAATTTSQAATHSADLQSKAASDALAFSKQQAEVDARNQEQARKANYDQWAAREQRLSSFGQMLGLPSRDIPAYQASNDPNYTPGSPAPTIPSTIGAAAGKASPVANGDYQAFFNSLTGGKPLDQKGLLALAPQIEAVGGEITPPSASGVISKVRFPGTPWVRVLNGDTNVASPTVWVPQGGAAAASSARPAATIGQAAQYTPLAVSPGLQMPTIGGMMR